MAWLETFVLHYIQVGGKTMNRLLIAAVITLVALPAGYGPSFARDMQFGDAAVVAKATPAVVNIATWKVRPPAEAGGSPRRVKTYGSGFIIDPSGTIVTNRHVIDGAFHVKVIFHNGDEANADVVAVAPMIDLAVLKVNVGSPLAALRWGDSRELRVGDAVLAIGNPLGFGMSVSAGIISAMNRDVQDTPFDNYIQTDAAINRGNSGGPLRPGDVLSAIGQTKLTDSRAFMRTIVQMPIGEPARLTIWRNGKEQIVSATVAEWPHIMPEGGTAANMAAAMDQKAPDPGVRLVPLTDAARQQYGLDEKLTGALVASVEFNCEARDLGIVPGDIITATLEASVTTPDDVHGAIQGAHEQHRPFLALLVQGKGGVRWVSLSIDPS
jgi:S1-C subfamily serine protease